MPARKKSKKIPYVAKTGFMKKFFPLPLVAGLLVVVGLGGFRVVTTTNARLNNTDSKILQQPVHTENTETNPAVTASDPVPNEQPTQLQTTTTNSTSPKKTNGPSQQPASENITYTRPALTTISIYAGTLRNSQDAFSYQSVSWWTNMQAHSPEGYMVYWATKEYDTQPSFPLTSATNDFKGSYFYSGENGGRYDVKIANGYTYMIQVCEKKGDGCGIKSQIIEVKAPYY
jgi:hypothetical protein